MDRGILYAQCNVTNRHQGNSKHVRKIRNSRHDHYGQWSMLHQRGVQIIPCSEWNRTYHFSSLPSSFQWISREGCPGGEARVEEKHVWQHSNQAGQSTVQLQDGSPEHHKCFTLRTVVGEEAKDQVGFVETKHG